MTNKIESCLNKIKPIPINNLVSAQEHLDSLTKPPGSLGRLEELGRRYAAIKGLVSPEVRAKALYVFAADHGVTWQGVSAFPQEVTAQMVFNFLRGGAAINILAEHYNTQMMVVDMGVKFDFPSSPSLVNKKIAKGTNDFALGHAMTRLNARKSIEVGIELATQAANDGFDILGTGDMGIGNTTASTAIIAAFTGHPVKQITGRGTGITEDVFQNKIRVIENALEFLEPNPRDPIDVLTKVGGFEIGAIAGFILGAAAAQTPVVIDGVISASGALIASGLNHAVNDYIFTSHCSQEPAHRAFFDLLALKPLFDFGMRLGEGTGAVIGMDLLEASVKIYSEMATFEDAEVSKSS